jgi:hypothetical protein
VLLKVGEDECSGVRVPACKGDLEDSKQKQSRLLACWVLWEGEK